MGCCAEPGRLLVSWLSELGGCGARSALAAGLVFLWIRCGRPVSQGAGGGSAGKPREGWTGRRAGPGASPAAPCTVRARRGRGPAVGGGRGCSAGSSLPPRLWARPLPPCAGGTLRGDGGERQKRRGALSLPLPPSALPVSEASCHCPPAARSTGPVRPKSGSVPALPWPSLRVTPAGSGTRWDTGEEGGWGMRKAVLLPVRRRELGKCKVREQRV